MKKSKLSLTDLKVSSFITDSEKSQILGGAITTDCVRTLPLADCVSDMAYSACRTCGIVCYPVE